MLCIRVEQGRSGECWGGVGEKMLRLLVRLGRGLEVGGLGLELLLLAGPEPVDWRCGRLRRTSLDGERGHVLPDGWIEHGRRHGHRLRPWPSRWYAGDLSERDDRFGRREVKDGQGGGAFGSLEEANSSSTAIGGGGGAAERRWRVERRTFPHRGRCRDGARTRNPLCKRSLLVLGANETLELSIPLRLVERGGGTRIDMSSALPTRSKRRTGSFPRSDSAARSIERSPLIAFLPPAPGSKRRACTT